MSKTTAFYRAPRYLFRKYNILSILKEHDDIKTFADIGCGAGELACTLAQIGYKGKGIDFSKDALIVANDIKTKRKLDDNKLTFVPGGLEKLKASTNDVVICCEVIEHIEDDQDFLKKLRKTNPKYTLFSVPAKQKWFDNFDRKVGHYRRYEKQTFTNLLDESGFEVINFISYGYPFINLTRLVRKIMIGRVKAQNSMKKSTQASGINPIKSQLLTKISIDRLIYILYLISKPFNSYDLSEGYLVLCKLKSKNN
ncbi:MAG: class I SAM-dependent methyltransferase [Candidatus Saccharimonadales bacterium]